MKKQIKPRRPPSPFPFILPYDPTKTVVDEACYCGGRRSEHKDTVVYGHGPCPEMKCGKYTWRCFIFREEPST